MTDQTPTLDDDFLDGCAIDFNEYADDEATQEMRALFPDGEVDREIEWRSLFREEDLDDIEGRLLGVMADEALRGIGEYSGSGRDLGIAARLRAMGLRVVEVAGWQTRGSSTFSPKGSVDHHTASNVRGGNAPSLGICTNGRPDLAGPLCHVLIARDNTCYVIASGRANHAGTGGQWGITGNSNVYGVERENNGTTERWREDQRVTAAKVHAALLKGIAPQYHRVCGHKEWAPTRKIDSWDTNYSDFRSRVAALLKPAPAPTPTPEPEEDDMPKPQMIRMGSKSSVVLYQAADRTVRVVPKDALAGYKLQQQLDGASPDVCVLASRNADGSWTHSDPNIVAWTKAIITMPFIGTMPKGWSEWWLGPHYPTPLALEDVQGACRQAIVETQT